MIEQYTHKVAFAFWHKSRKTFVPCTSEDVAKRSNLTVQRAGLVLREMVSDGLMKTEEKNNHHLYFITQKGREFVEAMQ